MSLPSSPTESEKRLTPEILSGVMLNEFLSLAEEHGDQVGSGDRKINAYIRMTNTPDTLDGVSLGESIAALFESAVNYYQGQVDLTQERTQTGVGEVIGLVKTEEKDVVDYDDFGKFVESDGPVWESFRTVSNCGDLGLRDSLGLAILRSARQEAIKRKNRGTDDFNAISFSGTPTLEIVLLELKRNSDRRFVNKDSGKVHTFQEITNLLGDDGRIESLKRGILETLGPVKKGLSREDYISTLVGQGKRSSCAFYQVLQEIPSSLDGGTSSFHKIILAALYMSLIESGKFSESEGVINGSVTMVLREQTKDES